MEQLAAFGLPVLCALISVAAAVVAFTSAQRPASLEAQSQLDELSALVEKMMKEQRKERMTRVRNAAKDTGVDPQDLAVPQGGLPSHQSDKAALRLIARQKGVIK